MQEKILQDFVFFAGLGICRDSALHFAVKAVAPAGPDGVYARWDPL